MKLIQFLAATIVALGLSTALAQEVPNDLRGILYDIDRAEQQMPSLTPDRGANIKRLQNSLSRTADRLQASANKDHPVWQDATARLDRLNTDLTALAAGRLPGTAPAAEAPAPSVVQVPAPAPAPAQQEIQLISSDVAKLNRLRRNVESSFADMRTGVATDEAQAYLDRLTAIDSQLAAMPQHPDVVAVRGSIAQTVPQLETMIASTPAPQAPQINSGQNAAPTELASADRAKFARLSRNTNGVFEELGALDPILLQPTATVARYENTLAGLRQNQASLISQGHPDVIAVGEMITAAQAILAEKAATAREQVASLGDFMPRFQTIGDKYRGMPEALRAPATLEQADTYLKSMLALSRSQAEDIQFLNDLASRTVLVAQQDMQRMQNWVGFEVLRSIDESLTQTVANMGGWANGTMIAIEFVEQTDPANQNDVVNRLLDQNRYQATLDNLNEGALALRIADGFEQFLKIADAPDRSAQGARLQAALANWPELQAIALRDVRLPQAQSTDPELIAIAKRVLSEPQDVPGGPIARVVVNSDIRSLSEEVGNASTGGSRTTVTVRFTNFVWDEFQVATAEEETPGNFRIYYTTFTYYTAGGRTTPLNRWTVSNRARSTPILAENIND